MYHGAAAFPRRAPGWPRWPFLAALGVHLLLAWSWRTAHPPAPETGVERIIDLVPVPPPRPDVPEARPALPRRTAATPRSRSGSAPAPTVRVSEPGTPPLEAPAIAADPFAVTVPGVPVHDVPVQSGVEAMVGRARREAGAIDGARREAGAIDGALRKGKSGIPAVADTPMGRFASALDSAYVDKRRGLTSDSYTTPDGQVIYRFRQGGRVWCRTSGGVAPGIGGATGGGATMFDVQGGEGRAGMIRCPSHGEWKPD